MRAAAGVVAEVERGGTGTGLRWRELHADGRTTAIGGDADWRGRSGREVSRVRAPETQAGNLQRGGTRVRDGDRLRSAGCALRLAAKTHRCRIQADLCRRSSAS